MVRAWPLAALLVASPGCALVLSRGATRQPLHVDSEPPGALATLEGTSCRTPCVLAAARTRDAVVTISTEQHEPVDAVFRSRLGERTLLNLLLPFPGVAIGLAADLVSGAAYDLVPSSVRIALPPEPPAGAAPTRAQREPRALAPLGPVRFAVTLGLGGGKIPTSDGGGLLQASALGTFRVSGPWIVGATADAGLSPPSFWDATATATTLAFAAGVQAAPTRNSRGTALLLAGRHRYEVDRAADLAAIGLRGDWTAVFGDGFALGAYVTYLRDLGRATISRDPWDQVEAGGDTVVIGLALGLLNRPAGAP